MNSVEKAINAGGTYWKDFYRGVKGNPWRIKPTQSMLDDVCIFSLSRSVNKGYQHQELELHEVIFDVEYVKAWKERHQEIFDVLYSLEVEGFSNASDLFAEFEALNNLKLMPKNPRHDLYIKFKEFCNDSQK